MHRISFSLLLLQLCVNQALGQFTYVLDQSIPLHDKTGAQLVVPWAGGFNSGQFNTLDLNGDGRDDLVVFDRMTKRVLTFLNETDHYRYDPDYETFFPEGISDWMLLRDFNCDGKKDIFTREDLGIVVYENITSGSHPEWKRYTKSVIYTMGTSSLINLLPGFNDVPVVADIDGDGDMDILNFRFVSPSTVEFHQNMSVELYGKCDSLVYDRVTSRYGDFEECLCGSFKFNGESCPVAGRLQHTQGRSLLSIDIDGDNDLDLLFSEENCSQLYYLKNDGTTTAPVINENDIFPFVHPVSLIYPTSFYEDVTFDNRKDLIIGTGLLSKPAPFASAVDVSLNHSAILYANEGSVNAPDFVYKKDNFLQDQMIDVGDDAVPAFTDADGDGDLDLFVSNDYGSPYHASIAFYENTGTVNEPSFQLSDEDYAFFSATDLFNLKIAFADIDLDGKVDLVFTATSSTTGQTWFSYVPNKSSSRLNLGGQTIVPLLMVSGFPASDNVSPMEVSGDGSMDLLIGKPDGSLQYWRNTGVSGNPSFVEEDATYLGLGSSLEHQNLSCAGADLDGDGKIDLVMGDGQGHLGIISDFRHVEGPVAKEDLIFNSISQTYTAKNLGGPLWATIANLFNSNRPSIVVGNQTGGVQILKNDNGASLPDEPLIRLFPNPVPGQGQARMLHVVSDRPVSLQLLTIMGQRIGEPFFLTDGETVVTLPAFLSQGVYLVQFSTSGKRFARRIVLL